MDQNQGNKLESIEKDIQKALNEKRIDENNAVDFIRALKFFIGNQPPIIQNLSAYKLLDDLIDLLPSSREKFETRIENLKILLELEPNNVTACSLIADLYEIIWEQESAIEYFKKTYELNHNPFYLFRIGIRYKFLNNNKSAIDYFKQCLDKGYTSYDVFAELGSAYFNIGDSFKARTNFIKSLQMNPDKLSEKDINSKLHFVELQITTILVNRFLRQINSEHIKPSYSYTEEGYFESCRGEEFTVWRQLVESDGREIMHVFDKQSNSIGFWLDSNSDFALLGFIFHHQDSPENIQYSVTPKRYEELDHNILVPRKDKDIKDPVIRSIDAKFAYEEYKKLQQYLKKSGIEIIPDFKIMVM